MPARDLFRPDPVTVRVWLVSLFLFWLCLGAVPSVLVYIFATPCAAVWVAVTATVFAVPIAVYFPFYFRTLVYTVGEDGLRIQRGLFWTRDMVIRYGRITSVSIDRGPLERLYGLAHVSIQTAGHGAASEAEGKLVGLSNPQAVQRKLERHLAAHGAAREEADAGTTRDGHHLEDYLRQILAELREVKNRL